MNKYFSFNIIYRAFSIIQLFNLFHPDHLFSQTFEIKNSDTINYTDKYGQSQYLWKIFYTNGGVFCEVYYKDGVFHGPCAFYHQNGKLRSQGYYADGNKTGIWHYFDENGRPLRDESILDKGIDEVWKS